MAVVGLDAAVAQLRQRFGCRRASRTASAGLVTPVRPCPMSISTSDAERSLAAGTRRQRIDARLAVDHHREVADPIARRDEPLDHARRESPAR